MSQLNPFFLGELAWAIAAALCLCVYFFTKKKEKVGQAAMFFFFCRVVWLAISPSFTEGRISPEVGALGSLAFLAFAGIGFYTYFFHGEAFSTERFFAVVSPLVFVMVVVLLLIFILAGGSFSDPGFALLFIITVVAASLTKNAPENHDRLKKSGVILVAVWTAAFLFEPFFFEKSGFRGLTADAFFQSLALNALWTVPLASFFIANMLQRGWIERKDGYTVFLLVFVVYAGSFLFRDPFFNSLFAQLPILKKTAQLAIGAASLFLLPGIAVFRARQKTSTA